MLFLHYDNTTKIALLAALACLAVTTSAVRQVQRLNNLNRIPVEFLIVLHKPTVAAIRVSCADEIANKSLPFQRFPF